MKQKKYKFKYDVKKGVVLAVDAVLFVVADGRLKVLLNGLESGGLADTWVLPGGFVQVDESLVGAAQRVLREKSGIRDIYLEQLYTFGDVDRDPRGRIVSTAYFALANESSVKQEEKGAHKICWFDVGDLPKMAYDHEEIIKKAVHRLKTKIQYTNIFANLLPKEVPFSELQGVCEIILGKKLDKRNFKKRMLLLDLVRPIAKKKSVGAHRPAQLYRFVDKKMVYLDNQFIY